MKKLLLLLLPAFMAACDDGPARPEGLLSEERMVALLCEIHLAEQQVSNFRLNPDSTRVVYSVLEKNIYKRADTDSARYVASLQYYTARPERLRAIYQTVLDTLMARERNLKQDRPPVQTPQ